MNKNSINLKTDEELVKLTLTNQEYFAFIIKRYEYKLLSYVLRISNLSVEDAEDVLQDVFIKVYQNLNSFDPKLKFSSWLYRICHNQVISNFRKIKARPQNISFDYKDELLDNLAAELDMAKEIDRNILHENLKKDLVKLDLKYKQVLILKYFEQKDYKEISDIIKKPMGSVATLINRAKKQLKKQISKKTNIL